MANPLNNFDFMKEEYLFLQKEIESLLTELRQNERNCFIAVVIGFSWVATQNHDGSDLIKLAWILPSAVPVFGAVRGWAIECHLKLLSKYIRIIEKKSRTSDTAYGWQHFVHKQRTFAIVKASRLYWVALLVASWAVTAFGIWDDAMHEKAYWLMDFLFE